MKRVKIPKKTLIIIFLVGIILMVGSGCAKKITSNIPKPASSRNPLKRVKFFAYQIQDQSEENNIQKLASSHYDLLVIDQTRSVKGDENYNDKKDVSLLKNSSNSSGDKKIVICYIDVGEAESYRWYWQREWRLGNPEWIVAPDPDGWDENYPVKFWHREWKTIMKKCLDCIITDGYDGIYLDWLEIYSFDPVARAARAEGLNPRLELTKFVRELSTYAHSKNPNFLLIAQNATELGKYPEYVRLFDGIAQESIWYDGGGDPDTGEKPGDVPINSDNSREYITDLKRWQNLGRPVFNIEYAQRASNTQRAYRLGQKYGFKTYVTLRPLDALTQTPPLGYK